MTELSRDEVQDRLVDLVHGRLAGAELAAVQRAVSADTALADELALLRSVHGAMRTPRQVDIAAIVAALPAAAQAAVAPEVDELAARRAQRTRPIMPLRWARAAAVVAVLGGGTILLTQRTHTTVAPAMPGAATAMAGADMQLNIGAPVDDLTMEQLDALRGDILALDGLPSADVEAASDLLGGGGA